MVQTFLYVVKALGKKGSEATIERGHIWTLLKETEESSRIDIHLHMII